MPRTRNRPVVALSQTARSLNAPNRRVDSGGAFAKCWLTASQFGINTCTKKNGAPVSKVRFSKDGSL